MYVKHLKFRVWSIFYGDFYVVLMSNSAESRTGGVCPILWPRLHSWKFGVVGEADKTLK